MKNFNPFFTQPLIALKAKKAGMRVKRKAVRRMDGAASMRAPEIVDGLQNQAVSAGAVNDIETGRRSFHNVETALHQNLVTLHIKTNTAVRADLVLSAGARDGQANIAAQLISEGTADYVNDENATANVTVSASWGILGTANAWNRFQSWVTRKGMVIGTTRLSYDTKAQAMHNLRFQEDNFFDDYKNDLIAPTAYYNPSNFDLLTVQSDVAYELHDDMVMYYSVEGNTEVLLSFWVKGIYNKNRNLSNFMRTNSVNSLG
ncbi:MAG: hypothetical protein AAFN10_25525 [Bacteroidota bacterium]